MDDADEIWNRACDVEFRPSCAGDRALAAILGFHSLAMNGGLGHSLEVDYEQARRASDGFRLFGSQALATLLDEACDAVARLAATGDFDLLDLTDVEEARLEVLERRYHTLVATDSQPETIFRRYLAASPDQFEPIR